MDELIIMFILIAISVLIFIATAPIVVVEGSKISPALLPRMCAVIIFVLAGFRTYLIITKRRSPSGLDLKISWKWEEVKRPLVTLIALLVYFLLFQRVSFIILNFFFLLFLCLSYGLRGWARNIIIAFLGTIGYYTLFKVIFKLSI